MSVQVPVPAISQGAVISLGGMPEADPQVSIPQPSFLVPQASPRPDCEGAIFSASSLERMQSDGMFSSGALRRMQSDTSQLGSWTPRSGLQPPSPGILAPGSGVSSWSPREGLRSGRRAPVWANGGGLAGSDASGNGDASPVQYTRSRSSLVLHRNTPPTSPSTWSTAPLVDPNQDPDAILIEPQSGRAWVHRDFDL